MARTSILNNIIPQRPGLKVRALQNDICHTWTWHLNGTDERNIPNAKIVTSFYNAALYKHLKYSEMTTCKARSRVLIRYKKSVKYSFINIFSDYSAGVFWQPFLSASWSDNNSVLKKWWHITIYGISIITSKCLNWSTSFGCSWCIGWI